MAAAVGQISCFPVEIWLRCLIVALLLMVHHVMHHVKASSQTNERDRSVPRVCAVQAGPSVEERGLYHSSLPFRFLIIMKTLLEV